MNEPVSPAVRHLTSVLLFGVWAHFDAPSAFAGLAAALVSLLYERMQH